MLTLRNMPEDLHAMLKESAERSRRSLNSEILARLEREPAAPTIDLKVHAEIESVHRPASEGGACAVCALQAQGPGVIERSAGSSQVRQGAGLKIRARPRLQWVRPTR